MHRLASLKRGAVYLRTVHPQLRVSQIDLLLTIAAKEGQSQTDLAMACDLTLAAISRAIDAMGTSGRRDGKGSKLGWLRTQRDPQDDRFVLVYLTDKGKKMLQTLADIVYSPQ